MTVPPRLFLISRFRRAKSDPNAQNASFFSVFRCPAKGVSWGCGREEVRFLAGALQADAGRKSINLRNRMKSLSFVDLFLKWSQMMKNKDVQMQRVWWSTRLDVERCRLCFPATGRKLSVPGFLSQLCLSKRALGCWSLKLEVTLQADSGPIAVNSSCTPFGLFLDDSPKGTTLKVQFSRSTLSPNGMRRELKCKNLLCRLASFAGKRLFQSWQSIHRSAVGEERWRKCSICFRFGVSNFSMTSNRHWSNCNLYI